MGSIPGKVTARLSAALKRYQPILSAAKDRDVNESDTSMIITDLMAEMYGYDKYNEVTRELCIRGTFCDLATRIDGKFQLLIEVKAVGIDLRDIHVKQAIDYAANQGIEWVALTNGTVWRVFRVIFGKPINFELVIEFDLLQLSPKREDDLQGLYLLTREGMLKSGLYAYHDQRQATSRFVLGALLVTDPVLDTLRRELRRLADVKVENEELAAVLTQEVIKREVFEGEKAEAARRKVQRATGRLLRQKKEQEAVGADAVHPAPMPTSEPVA
jgi:hypothetical protein